MGAIFMLHHVRPQKEPFPGFHPNSCLETSPEFLDAVLDRLRVLDFEFVSLRDAVNRIRSGDQSGRFAAFTIDDGYLDNAEHALPLFQRYACPFTVFAATKIIDGEAELWWLALEQVIAENETVSFCIDGRQTDFQISTAPEKQSAYDTIYWTLRSIPEAEQRRKIRNLCSRYGVNLKKLCRREAMTWDQLRELADDPLVTVGAHTVNHVALGKLPTGTGAVGDQGVAQDAGGGAWPARSITSVTPTAMRLPPGPANSSSPGRSAWRPPSPHARA